MKNASFALYIWVFLLFVSFSCRKQEDATLACESIVCLNDGKCEEGICNCSESFSGPRCATQNPPLEIRISNVIVTRFPSNINGFSWDLMSKADIYWVMKTAIDTLFVSPYYYENSDFDMAYDFPQDPYLKILDASAQYSIHLVDFDDDGEDDYMGGINFSIYNDTNNFPAHISIDKGGDLAFELKVTYAW